MLQLDRTALHCAAACGHVAVTEVLLEGGADLEAKDKVRHRGGGGGGGAEDVMGMLLMMVVVCCCCRLSFLDVGSAFTILFVLLSSSR